MIPRKKLVDPSVHVRDARLFILVVEGSETEPAYFEALQRSDLIPKHRVIIRVIKPEEHKTAPHHLISNAEKAIASIGKRMPDDECWLIFDVDKRSGSNRIEQIHDTLRVSRGQGWFVALSNPCFEVWLLLHFVDDLSGITDKGQTATDKLRAIVGGYNKCHPPAECLRIETLETAVRRAQTLDVDPQSPLPPLPSTRVYRVVERLRRVRP